MKSGNCRIFYFEILTVDKISFTRAKSIAEISLVFLPKVQKCQLFYMYFSNFITH